MTSLESIVLPLEQSRSLVEHGVVLDTALRWVTNPHNKEPFVIPVWFPPADGETVICSAWVLSELLDAIWAKYPDATISTFRRKGFGTDVDIDDDLAGFHKGAGLYPTDLLAAAALLLEVAK